MPSHYELPEYTAYYKKAIALQLLMEGYVDKNELRDALKRKTDQDFREELFQTAFETIAAQTRTLVAACEQEINKYWP